MCPKGTSTKLLLYVESQHRNCAQISLLSPKALELRHD
ncbi:hypothetical protein APS_2643 [Acetobacter pasteurianus subsp. pasteurianus LMG 1262 = NBRC 106471]|nr:hypothetical protein APS_2643 [Acetobacter pasteurianus subsp. pasteurianus LMG 1262 = NBRC 106471]